jgi:formamidopyrimidine-DNA glycosylase
MPELPEITVYQERLRAMVSGHVLRGVRLNSHFLLRTVEPPLTALVGRTLQTVERSGKQLILEFDDAHFAVIHLMITGRLRFKSPGAGLGGKRGLLAFDFDHGALLWTEASSKKRSSLHLVRGRAALAAFDRGGLEISSADEAAFTAALRRENRTLKRALTDPRLFSGIGNAFSDEILHRARLSPLQQTARLADADVARLHAATRAVLVEWTGRLRTEAGDGFPGKVTAFREGMAVHGRFGEPCPVCGAPVQRIRYAENETNYCARCQTGGRVLADRSLSRLLGADWPRSIDELE